MAKATRKVKKKNNNNKKKTIGVISKKATLHVKHTFFYTFFCRCFAPLKRETSRNFLVTRFMEEMSYVFLFTFFLCRSFSPRWPLAFLIFSPPLQNFMLFLQQKMPPLFFLSRSSSFSRWASLACHLTFSVSLSSFFSIFQICGHDN